MDLQDLYQHKVAKRMLNEAMKTHREVYGDKPPSIDSEDDVVPYENQFYVLQVGYWISTLLTWCKQLDHAVLYISNYSASKTMKKAGISRHAHLAYHIENYIIRVESIYDRVLHLVDAVFHLCNSPANCTHDNIVSNLKVKRTNIPPSLKPLKKALKPYIFERNTIVHHESYKDKELRRLELYSFVSVNTEHLDEQLKRALPWLQKETTSDIIREKKKEFSRLNKKIAIIISNILDKLEPHFDKQKQRLA